MRADYSEHVEDYVEKKELTEDGHREILCRLDYDLEVFKFTEHLDDAEVSELEEGVDPCKSPVNRDATFKREIDYVRGPVDKLKNGF